MRLLLCCRCSRILDAFTGKALKVQVNYSAKMLHADMDQIFAHKKKYQATNYRNGELQTSRQFIAVALEMHLHEYVEFIGKT